MKTKALLLALTTTVFAVGAQAQTTFGIRAGVNFQNINGKDFAGDKLDHNLKTGFHAGVNAEIPVAPEFYIQPGVLYSTKGAVNSDDKDIKYNLSYVEVPINFLFKPTLGAGKLLLGVGPYVAFGIGGNVSNASGNKKDIEFKNEVSAGDYALGGTPTPFYRRMDVGGNLLAGYEFSNKLSFQLNAQLGMLKINSEITGVSSDKSDFKNTGFGLSLGYRL